MTENKEKNNSQGLRVLSLFDGISCGRVALDRINIPVSEYNAFEIEENAIKISRYNYPDIKRYGDVFSTDFKGFNGVDLLMGGSPCQFWSKAKCSKTAKLKREIDTEGEGWKLFQKFVEAKNNTSPKYFLYENNYGMADEIQDAISEELTGNYEDQEHNEEVFKIFHDRIRKNLENKKNVIADATNLTMKSRRAIMMKVNGLNVRKVCVIIPKPFEQCKEDNLHREHPVPDFVLDKQIRKFQIPFYEEGFDEIIIHNLLNNYEPNDIPDMRGFDQKNPHHIMDLFEHCKYASRLFSTKYAYPARFRIGALYHDLGKLSTQTFDEDGIAHYYQHHCYGSYQYMTAIYHVDSDAVLDTCFLINYHMMPFNWDTDKAKQRWKERFGEYKYKMLLDFNECDRAR